MYLPLGKSKYF